MKHSSWLLAVGFWAALGSLHAADVQAHWNELCKVAAGRQLNVTTSDGKTLSGTCASTNGDELSLSDKQMVTKIARSTLTRIQMYDPGTGHHLADLGNGMSKSFKTGFEWLFSPAAPAGLVAIPATIVWGAIAAPFCILGDMGSDGPTTQDVHVSN